MPAPEFPTKYVVEVNEGESNTVLFATESLRPFVGDEIVLTEDEYNDAIDRGVPIQGNKLIVLEVRYQRTEKVWFATCGSAPQLPG